MKENQKHTRDPLSLSKEDLETLFESTFEQVSSEPIKKKQKDTPKTPYFEGSKPQDFSRTKKITADSKIEKLKPLDADSRPKSSLRVKYETEVESIKSSSGDLESIRRKLGLSKRKMAQLLLVDPSAWTRWTAKKGEAPPHIYRALQWYLLLQDKHPEYRSSLWLNSVATPQISGHELENIKKTLISGARGELSAKADQIINTRLSSHKLLEDRLNHSKVQIMSLNKRLKWLLLGQVIVLSCFAIFLLLM